MAGEGVCTTKSPNNTEVRGIIERQVSLILGVPPPPPHTHCKELPLLIYCLLVSGQNLVQIFRDLKCVGLVLSKGAKTMMGILTDTADLS